MKFIRNGLLTILGDDSKIYTFSARRNMEMALEFELPSKKVIEKLTIIYLLSFFKGDS